VVEGQGVPTTSGAGMGQLVDHNFALYFFNPLFSTPSTVLYIILLIFVVQKIKTIQEQKMLFKKLRQLPDF